MHRRHAHGVALALAALMVGAAVPALAGPGVLNDTPTAKLEPGGPTYGFAGRDVDVSPDGTVAIVGQPYHGTGAAHVYEDRPGGWTKTATLSPASAENGDAVGYSVALKNGLALVGAPGTDDREGAAYVYEDTATGWQLATTLEDPISSFDLLGMAVDVDGDTALVGGLGNTVAFVDDGTGWSLQDRLGQPAREAVAIDGDRAVVADRTEDHSDTRHAGAVYVFDRSGGSFSQTARLTNDDPNKHTHLGEGLGLHDDMILAGAPDQRTADGETGIVYVFQETPAGWTTTTIDAPSGERDFGTSVGLSGDGTMAVIGAEGPVRLSDRGDAYGYTYTAGTWTRTADLASGDPNDIDHFGHAAAMNCDGSVAVVGEPGDVHAGARRGAAFVYTGTALPAVC